MEQSRTHWELVVLDGKKYAACDNRLVDLLCADFDGDGRNEILTTST